MTKLLLFSAKYVRKNRISVKRKSFIINILLINGKKGLYILYFRVILFKRKSNFITISLKK